MPHLPALLIVWQVTIARKASGCVWHPRVGVLWALQEMRQVCHGHIIFISIGKSINSRI